MYRWDVLKLLLVIVRICLKYTLKTSTIGLGKKRITAPHHHMGFPFIGRNLENMLLNPITQGGGVFRTPSNFAAFGDPLKVEYIEMFHADFSYLSIY